MLLKKLTEAMGPSGFETEIRNVIRTEIDPLVDRHYTDVLGTLIAEKNANHKGPRVMLDAHMDEVGLMIVHAEENGLLRFRPLGGIDPRVLVSKPVHIGDERRFGVIGSKPIHLQSAEERRNPLKMDQLYIDIGARDKEDALSAVKLGDTAVFTTKYEPIGDNCAKAKSFDDRVGCAIVIEALKKSYDLPLFAAFTVQEEVGLRGATAAAYRLQPDIAIALEGTVCFDVVDAPGHGQSTVLGAGPALTVQDGRTIADRRFLDFMISVAKKHSIPYQLRRVKGGSNDFGAIHQVREGVIGGGISVPVRYIHAPAQIISLDDFHNSIRLLEAVLKEIQEGGFTL
ncbi:M42 family metallopeptidase [Alicyclobacillus tolerans]|uniref:M42 family metallopeptidase n=1 Tax=Alicyclobacillus tolerans TaxID=90970 RepID=UPI001F3B0590|nr:M42 family metallopeptidase [Alicyclobacillus tolerans]MCF8563756.1 M42 family metallopeptidase [Alicyclobacillus tolerans]